VEPPTIVLTAADSATGTLTFSLSQDPLFPAATTEIFLIDPVTGSVVTSFPGETPPTAVLGPGITVTDPYVILAVTTDAGPPVTTSPPSRPVDLNPEGWDDTYKTVVVTDYIKNAKTYELWRIDTGVPSLISTSPVHWLVDDTVYADEPTAQKVQYEIRPIVFGDNAGQARVVRRFRTTARLCFVTGYATGLDGNPDADREIWFGIKNYGTRKTLKPREIQPFYQSRQISKEEIRVHTNIDGVFGAYLIQEALVEIDIPNTHFHAEFVVPTTATADLETLPLVARPIIPHLS